MSRPPDSEGEPIEKKSQLIEDLESGCKSKENWRIGTEHEKFPFRLSDNKRLTYEGPDGIAEILNRLTRFGWQPIREKDNVIALSLEGCAITLEPGGQFELSGAPLETIHQTCDEVHTHLAQVKEVGDELGIGMLGLGFDPKWTRNEVPWMPKGRYSIMKRWMQEVGTLGLDMMLRTCTVQTNLDFSHEADMAQKYRISIALQPLATALFANSPFQEGENSSLLDIIEDSEAEEPEAKIMMESMSEEVNGALETLSERERVVLEMYFGINRDSAMTLNEIGEEFDLTRERVRQIKEKAIQRLRHRSRSKNLRRYLG